MIHDQFVLVEADQKKKTQKTKKTKSLFFVRFIMNCILKELGFNLASGTPTYTHSSLSIEKFLQNQKSDSNIFNITTKLNVNCLIYIEYLNVIKRTTYELNLAPKICHF